MDATGADISAPDASGWTLLLDAAASQNLTLCLELLRLKANPSVRTDSGNTILHSLVRVDLVCAFAEWSCRSRWALDRTPSAPRKKPPS